jgi:hypothetical protein
MRLLVTSDLHYDPRGHLTDAATLRVLVETMAKASPSAVVLAGDLAHGLDAFGACVAMFTPLACPIYVLAGNHDVWKDKTRNIPSETLWSTELRKVTQASGGIWLEDAVARFGRIGIAGSLAWYDYSAIDRDADVSPAAAGKLKPHLNNDAHWIDWDRTDIGFASTLSDALVARVQTLVRDPSIERIAVITHVPILEEQMHRKPGDKTWGTSNAYYGHLTLGERLRHEPKLHAVVSGHTHWGVETLCPRPGLAPLDVRVVGSDYKIPNFLSLEL